MERATGFEPATSTLGRWHSTAELRPLVYCGDDLLVQSPTVAFKHNIPIPVVVFGLIAAVLAGLVLFHTPPDEDLLRQAVDAYVAKLGNVKQMELHPPVADIIAGEKNTLIYALFEKKDGTWTYAKNLAEEFSAAMKDAELQSGILRRLGEKVSARFQQSVSFPNLKSFDYDLARDVSSGELLGSCSVPFTYPAPPNTPPKTGLYIETFEWKDGKWQSRGPGSLYDAIKR